MDALYIAAAIATILGLVITAWSAFRARSNATNASSVSVATVPDPVEKWVDFDYPRASGLQAKLSEDGYKVAWCLDTKLARRVDLEGWQVVVEPDVNGVLSKFRLKDRPADQTLIKKATTQRDLSEEEIELLMLSAEKGELLVISADQVGSWVQVDSKNFMDKNDPALAARYLEAMETLRRKGFVQHVGGIRHQLTGSGFKIAREYAKHPRHSAD